VKVAIFVDAGFLFAACYKARFKEEGERFTYALEDSDVLSALRSKAAALDGGGGRLVRIYWYDAGVNYAPNPSHLRTWENDDVKMRLGVIRRNPETKAATQKGVDSLIVHDLTELARHHAIDIALLLSGDEDLLVAVTAAQSFGVRVHLLGIEGAGIARRLKLEADAYHEWPQQDVAPWVIPLYETQRSTRQEPKASRTGDGLRQQLATEVEMSSIVDEILRRFDLRPSGLWATIQDGNSVPSNVYGLLMALVKAKLGSEQSGAERISVLQQFKEAIRERANGKS
jgi:uncharacterized LabA/DUF88 family protein